MGSSASKNAGLGAPSSVCEEETSISTNPQSVPPPCASLNASPLRHASKLGLSSQMVNELVQKRKEKKAVPETSIIPSQRTPPPP